MKRSGGVTAAAVVALLGSAGLGLVAFSELSGALFISRFHPGGQALPEEGVIPAVASMVMGSLFNLAFAGWGLATGVGLIRLKPWSRISTLVYAGLTGVCASFAGLIILFVPIPGPANASQNFSGIFHVALELFLAIPFSIAIWWLILFTRKSVVAQFSGTPGPEVAAQLTDTAAVPVAGTPPPQRPMIITILAWFFLVSAISSVPAYFWILFGPLKDMPFPFFGAMLHGKVMLIYYPLSVLLLLAAGAALLKNKVWGYWLALAIHLFNFLNVSAMIVLPGRAARLQGLMESVPFKLPPGAELPSNFLVTMEAFGLGAGLILSLIVLSLLLMSRKRFFELAAIQAPSATSAG